MSEYVEKMVGDMFEAQIEGADIWWNSGLTAWNTSNPNEILAQELALTSPAGSPRPRHIA